MTKNDILLGSIIDKLHVVDDTTMIGTQMFLMHTLNRLLKNCHQSIVTSSTVTSLFNNPALTTPMTLEFKNVAMSSVTFATVLAPTTSEFPHRNSPNENLTTIIGPTLQTFTMITMPSVPVESSKIFKHVFPKMALLGLDHEARQTMGLILRLAREPTYTFPCTNTTDRKWVHESKWAVRESRLSNVQFAKIMRN